MFEELVEDMAKCPQCEGCAIADSEEGPSVLQLN